MLPELPVARCFGNVIVIVFLSLLRADLAPDE
jgi:hypothetical protein